MELIKSGHIFNRWAGSGSVVNYTDNTIMNGYVWGSHINIKGYNNGYIDINPSGHTYLYDIVFSNTNGSLLYIGFERYDSAKTPTSNNSCIYVYASTEGCTKRRIKGTVNLATDDAGSPTKYIKLRLLNDWNNVSSSNISTFYHISLREVSTLKQYEIDKNGIIKGDLLREDGSGMEIGKNGVIVTTEIKEI